MKTCEKGRMKDFEQRPRVYNAVCYNAFFPLDRVIMEILYKQRKERNVHSKLISLYPPKSLNFIYFTTITKQVIQLILII